MKISKVLKDIGVIIEDQAISQGQIIYFCQTPHLDKEFFGSHVIIVDDKESPTKTLSCSPIKVKNREKVLEVINDINQELTCGCVTLSEDNFVCYDMAIYFPKTIKLDYSVMMLSEFIYRFEYFIPIIWDKLNSAGVIVEIMQLNYHIN